MKLKDYIKKALEIPKDLFKRFPFSISLSILASIIIAVFLESDFLEDAIYFIFLFPIGILFSEIFFKDNKKIEIVSFIISLIIAMIGNKYIRESNELVIRLAAIYCISLTILGLIKLFKDSKLSLNEYVTRVAANSFKVQVVSGIISSGILAITGIIILLFKASEMMIVRAELIFAGSFVIPAFIYAFSDTKEEVWDFIKFIIKNLTSVILIIAFAIIYIYMLKIFITFKIPSNHIFRITGLLFLMGLPIWTMVSSFEKENIFVKINNILPIAFIPFVGLQIYSIAVRISNNGITIMRYCGILLIIFEILYIITYMAKKDKIYYLGYVLIAMSIIGIIIPKISATEVVVNSQYKIMMNYLNKEKLNDDEKDSLYSAYYYLTDFKEGKVLVDKLSNDQIDKITLNNTEVDFNCYYNYGSDSYNNLDISGYSRFSEFRVFGDDINKSYDIFNHIDIYGHDVNMSAEIKNFVKREKYGDEYKYSNIIVTDEYKVELKDIHVCIEDSLVNSYTISGYILEK